MDEAVDYLKKHPVFVLTLAALFCSCVGFWSEYSLLRNFGLNIGVFASIEYFLLAGVSSPESLGLFTLIIILNVKKISSINNILNVTPERAKKYWGWYLTIFVFIIFMIGDGLYKNANEKYKEIVNAPRGFSKVVLRTDNKPISEDIYDLTLITSTDLFMLFYQHSKSEVIAVPTQNISSVSFYDAPVENEDAIPL